MEHVNSELLFILASPSSLYVELFTVLSWPSPPLSHQKLTVSHTHHSPGIFLAKVWSQQMLSQLSSSLAMPQQQIWQCVSNVKAEQVWQCPSSCSSCPLRRRRGASQPAQVFPLHLLLLLFLQLLLHRAPCSTLSQFQLTSSFKFIYIWSLKYSSNSTFVDIFVVVDNFWQFWFLTMLKFWQSLTI